MFTIAQILWDALMWCRYYAANQSIGLQEMAIIFYEAFQYTYEQAIQQFPEYFEVSDTWTGASYTLPASFRKLDIVVVDDAGCTAGYAREIDPTEWDVREGNTRLQGTVTNPHCKINTSSITISPSMTGGLVFYFRTYSEADFTDQTQLLVKFLPLAFHPLLLSKMMELVQVRQYQLTSDPSVRDRYEALKSATKRKAAATLKPMQIIEGISDKPMSIISSPVENGQTG